MSRLLLLLLLLLYLLWWWLLLFMTLLLLLMMLMVVLDSALQLIVMCSYAWWVLPRSVFLVLFFVSCACFLSSVLCASLVGCSQLRL